MYWQYLLFAVFFVNIVQSNMNISIGLIFYDYDQNYPLELNNLARNYIFEKFPENLSYNLIEYYQIIDFNSKTLQTWPSLCTYLSKRIFSLITHLTFDDFNWLPTFSSTYHIPLINLNNNYLPISYTLSLKPDILPALITILHYYQIKQFVYIYNDINGANRLKQLMNIQTTEKLFEFNILNRYLDNIDDAYDLLYNIELITGSSFRIYGKYSFGRYIILDFSSIEIYQIFMDKIKHRGMTTSDYHYILLSLNAHQLDMTYFRYGGVNVTFFVLPKISNEYTIQLQTQNIYSIESLLLTDAWELISRTINRLTNSSRNLQSNVNCEKAEILSWKYGKLVWEHFLQTSFQGLTGFIEFDRRTGQRTNYTFEIHRVTRNNLPKRIGYFRAPNRLEIADESTNRFRSTYDNHTRLIVTIFDEPFIMLKKTRNSTLTESEIPRGTILDPSMVEGYCVDLAYEICHNRLQIPYKFLIETKYGKEISKGVWDGMVGALVTREADLSIASLTINGAREKAVDFSKPFIDLGISIMIRKPEKQKPGVFSFMDPLSTEIWICVIISYIFVSAILYFVSRFSSYEWYFENETDIKPRNKFSWFNALFFSFAAFMHQGVDLLPRSISGRVVTGVWWFFSLILVASYTANLAAFLTVEKLVTPIETVEDLASQTDIRYGTLRGGSTMAFFNKSTLTTFKRMWNFMQQHKDDVFVQSNRDGIEKVRRSKGKFAFLLESTLNEYVNERSPCDTMRIGENIDAKGYGIATPLGSDLREAINIAVLELTESGFLNSLKQKWYIEGSECTSSGAKDAKQSTALNLANVAGMFYVLIIGLGSSMIIALCEFLFKAKIDSIRLNQNVREVMRRNLRISITGIDFDEKLNYADYWPLQQQQQQLVQQQKPLNRNQLSVRQERTATFSSALEVQKKDDFQGRKSTNITHL